MVGEGRRGSRIQGVWRYTTVWHSCTHEHNLHQCYDQGPFRIISRDEIRISLIQIQTKSLERDTFSKRYYPPILRHLLQSSTGRNLPLRRLFTHWLLFCASEADRSSTSLSLLQTKIQVKTKNKCRNTQIQVQTQRQMQIDKYNELRFCALEADRLSSISLSAMPVY